MNMREVLDRLSAPIPPEEMGWKPQVVKAAEKRALMVAYIDARFVAKRLDEALDGDWSFSYEVLSNTPDSVVIKGIISIRGNSRADVGEYHKHDNDSMEMFKAAVSDAFKRAAVLWGVGRELYSLPTQWVPYNKGVSKADMERLNNMVRGHQGTAADEPVAEGETGDDRTVDLSPLQPAIDKLNSAFDFSFNAGQVVLGAYGVDIPSDVESMKSGIAKWYREQAVEAIATKHEAKGYEIDKVLAYVDEHVTDRTWGGLSKQRAAMHEYFGGKEG